MPIPICVKRLLSMLALWPGELYQAFVTVAAVIFYQYFLNDTVPKELTLRKTFEK